MSNSALTSQDPSEPSFDDPAIANDDVLLRVCKTDFQVVPDKLTGRYVLSDQAFSPNGPGVSVNVVALYEADGLSDADRTKMQGGYAALRITAGDARSVQNRDAEGKPAGHLKVAYTPLGPEHGGPDPYHADIFPRTSRSANRELKKKSVETVPVDQALAAAAHAKRHSG